MNLPDISVTKKSLTAMARYTSKLKASFSWLFLLKILRFWNRNTPAAYILALGYVCNNGNPATYLTILKIAFVKSILRASDFLFRRHEAKPYTNTERLADFWYYS